MTRRLGFWETLFDDNLSFREREVINAAADAAAAAGANAEHLARQIWVLSQRVDILEKQNKRLQVVVRVLTDELGGSEVVSDAVLEAKIDAALDALEPPAPPVGAPGAPGGGPYRGGPDAPGSGAGAVSPPMPQRQCARCEAWMPMDQLTFNGQVMLCERCKR